MMACVGLKTQQLLSSTMMMLKERQGGGAEVAVACGMSRHMASSPTVSAVGFV